MIIYRNATNQELSTILKWAEKEGWNPGLDDATTFWLTDPKGFFVATDGDKTIAAISVVNHTEEFAFLGLYITHPSYRGQGIGYALWQHALTHAGPRTIGLDGVPEQQSNYAASGFVHSSATTRYTGQINASCHAKIRKAIAEDTDNLVALEGRAAGVCKPVYVSDWVANTSTRTTWVLEREGTVRGFCTVRMCVEGAKVGPLLATSAQDAQQLLEHAAAFAGPALTIDVPDTSSPLKQLCSKLGFKPGFTTARMYRGPFRSVENTFFAIVTMELG
ncbi:GNAT family N-acetyltransferase [Shimia sp. NS0008-38b]|uniref:GNAT family N-acetyltransferase n=1 Tax=Shimia sp. NS0008-38b TaxID=3127653 RepID=UPI003341DA28